MPRHLINKIPLEISHSKFLSKILVNNETGCWEWNGCTCKRSKYGLFYHKYKIYRAHRVSFDIFKNEELSLDPEIVIDHMCRNRVCVNPDHLRQVDQVTNALENTASSALTRKLQTQCKRGHEFTEDNTIISGVGVNGGIWRKCRACTTAKNKERWKKFKSSRATK